MGREGKGKLEVVVFVYGLREEYGQTWTVVALASLWVVSESARLAS